NVLGKEEAVLTGGTYLVGCYDIILNARGELEGYRRISPVQDAEGDKWYAWCMAGESDPWFNDQTYVDTLSKAAMDKFIEITYESYKNAVGDKFGGVVPAIFTDEPQFEEKRALR